MHEGQESEKFKPLTLEYMSAESSSEETDDVVVHKHKWRSDSMLHYDVHDSVILEVVQNLTNFLMSSINVLRQQEMIPRNLSQKENQE